MLHDIEARIASRAALGPSFLRVGLGVVFLAHAYAKAAIFTFSGTAAFFEAFGFPGWTAYPVFAIELLGGLSLLAGFRTRAVAAVLALLMLGALRPHAGNGWMFSQPGGGWEYVAFLIVALVALVFTGSGAFAVSRAREGTLAEARARGPVMTS